MKDRRRFRGGEPGRLAAVVGSGLLMTWAGVALLGRELPAIEGRAAAHDLIALYGAPETRLISGVLEGLGEDAADSELLQRKLELELMRLKGVIQRREGDAAQKAFAISAERNAFQLARAAPLNMWAWCALADLSLRNGGFSAAAVKRLDLCYETAPHEGAMAPGRMQLAMALWPLLPGTLRARAVNDAVSILREGEGAAGGVGRLAAVVRTAAPEAREALRAVVASRRPDLVETYERLSAEPASR